MGKVGGDAAYGLLEGVVAPEGAGVEEPAEGGGGGWHGGGNCAVAGLSGGGALLWGGWLGHGLCIQGLGSSW